MKKNLLILIMLSVVLYSCGNSFGGFDPRAYNKRPSSGNNEGGEEDGGDDFVIPEGYDPFKDELYKDPNKHYPAANFKSWNFRVTSISDKNVPAYIFDKDRPSKWSLSDGTKSEYIYYNNEDELTAQGYTLEDVRYYKYESKHPVFTWDSSYNTGAHGERMERFYFYRFYGKPPAVRATDNYTIAVDTYNKLVFAFAKPTDYKGVLGNWIPIEWGSIDNNTKNDKGETRPFYEYDPIGYVDSEGKVHIRQWFIDLLTIGGENLKVDPKIDPIYQGASGHVTVADGGLRSLTGRSPYYIVNGDPFLGLVKLKSFSLRKDYPNSLILHTYDFADDGKSVTYKTTAWLGNGSVLEGTFRDYQKINDTSGRYGNTTFELREKGTKLYIGNEHVGTLDYNELPQFYDRVKGATFVGGDNWKENCSKRRHTFCGHNKTSFTFNTDGKGFSFYTEKSYMYSCANGDYVYSKDINGNATYQFQGSFSIIIDKYVNPFYGVGLDYDDNEIWSTSVGAGGLEGGIIFSGGDAGKNKHNKAFRQ